VPISFAPAEPKAASCSGRNMDGPQPKRPSLGSKLLGIRISGIPMSLVACEFPDKGTWRVAPEIHGLELPSCLNQSIWAVGSEMFPPPGIRSLELIVSIQD
jgi:hypothetical protein